MEPLLGYVFLFVPDVAAALEYYQGAFGLRRRYLDDSGMYGELETGATVFAFAQDDFAQTGNGIRHRRNNAEDDPPGISFTLVTNDLDAAWARAVSFGVDVVSPPATKPWGQRVGYLRDPQGIIVELATPVEV